MDNADFSLLKFALEYTSSTPQEGDDEAARAARAASTVRATTAADYAWLKAAFTQQETPFQKTTRLLKVLETESDETQIISLLDHFADLMDERFFATCFAQQGGTELIKRFLSHDNEEVLLAALTTASISAHNEETVQTLYVNGGVVDQVCAMLLVEQNAPVTHKLLKCLSAFSAGNDVVEKYLFAKHTATLRQLTLLYASSSSLRFRGLAMNFLSRVVVTQPTFADIVASLGYLDLFVGALASPDSSIAQKAFKSLRKLLSPSSSSSTTTSTPSPSMEANRKYLLNIGLASSLQTYLERVEAERAEEEDEYYQEDLDQSLSHIRELLAASV